ncbi:MAG: VanZ family protein [Vicinamibacterales bacterium]
MSPRVLPTRRTYAWLAGAAIAFVFYASLIPFHLTPVPLGDALQHFKAAILSASLGRMSRTNFLANVLLTVPVGFGLAGARLCDRGWRVRSVLGAAIVALGAGLLVSLGAEFLQEFAPGRVPALADVQAQMIGCLAGVIAWLVAGPTLTTWVRMAQLRRGHDRLAQVLIAYAFVWASVNLAPFDITLDLGELSQRVHSGMITIVPFAGAGQPLTRVLWDAVMAVVSAIPLGALGVVVGPRVARTPTPLVAFITGAALVAGLEVAQIFIVSHAADITDVLGGCIGVGLGVAIARRLLPARHEVRSRPVAAASRGAALLLGCWVLVVVVYHWMPYDFSTDRGMIRGKIAGLSFVPFAGYAPGSDLNALNDVLAKLGLAAPLGVLAAFVQRRGRPIFTLASALACFAALFVLVESGQLFLPTRSPDPTDVATGIAGAMAGLFLGRWIKEE